MWNSIVVEGLKGFGKFCLSVNSFGSELSSSITVDSSGINSPNELKLVVVASAKLFMVSISVSSFSQTGLSDGSHAALSR